MIPRVEGVDRFNATIRRTARVLPERVGSLHRRAFATGVEETENRSPVDRAFLRGNWHASQDTPVTAFDATSSSSRLEANLAVAAAAPPFSASYLTNTAPYARKIENGGFIPPDPKTDAESLARRAARRDARQRGRAQDLAGDPGAPLVRGGYSIQAPQGVLGVSFAVVVAFVERAVRRLGGRLL